MCDPVASPYPPMAAGEPPATGSPRRFALTGGSSDYYRIPVEHPTTGDQQAYIAECNDLIEALDMTFAEANVFKAVWRSASARLGNGKPGTSALYDAEKVVFFGGRMVVRAQRETEAS